MRFYYNKKIHNLSIISFSINWYYGDYASNQSQFKVFLREFIGNLLNIDSMYVSAPNFQSISNSCTLLTFTILLNQSDTDINIYYNKFKGFFNSDYSANNIFMNQFNALFSGVVTLPYGETTLIYFENNLPNTINSMNITTIYIVHVDQAESITLNIPFSEFSNYIAGQNGDLTICTNGFYKAAIEKSINSAIKSTGVFQNVPSVNTTLGNMEEHYNFTTLFLDIAYFDPPYTSSAAGPVSVPAVQSLFIPNNGSSVTPGAQAKQKLIDIFIQHGFPRNIMIYYNTPTGNVQLTTLAESNFPVLENPGNIVLTHGGQITIYQIALNTGIISWTYSTLPSGVIILSSSDSSITLSVNSTPISQTPITVTATNPRGDLNSVTFSLTNS